MQAKRRTDITVLDELDYVGHLASIGALPSHLLARIARRPGRWRQRMQPRPQWDVVILQDLDEAA